MERRCLYMGDVYVGVRIGEWNAWRDARARGARESECMFVCEFYNINNIIIIKSYIALSGIHPLVIHAEPINSASHGLPRARGRSRSHCGNFHRRLNESVDSWTACWSGGKGLR